MPSFHLSLTPVIDTTKNLLGLFQLPVGKIKIEEQKVLLDEEYMPPCSSINSRYDLLEIHATLEQFYAKMETYSLQIIQKIRQKKQNNELTVVIDKLCDNIIVLTASHLAEIKAISMYQPPVHLFTKLCSFARLVKNTLDYYQGTGKEELINYFTDWGEISQGELEGSIIDLANHQYNHLELKSSIVKILLFTKIMTNLFDKLACLEYLGKRKDVNIFVKEKLVDKEPMPFTKRASFLADGE
jgi:hypothetical protein